MEGGVRTPQTPFTYLSTPMRTNSLENTHCRWTLPRIADTLLMFFFLFMPFFQKTGRGRSETRQSVENRFAENTQQV